MVANRIYQIGQNLVDSEMAGIIEGFRGDGLSKAGVERRLSGANR
jgi:hypothetical protein